MFRKKLVEVLDLILNLNSKDQCDLIYETGQKLNEINLNIIKFINEIIAYQNAIIFYYNVGSSDNLNDFEKTYNINIGISKQKSNKFDLKKYKLNIMHKMIEIYDEGKIINQKIINLNQKIIELNQKIDDTVISQENQELKNPKLQTKISDSLHKSSNSIKISENTKDDSPQLQPEIFESIHSFNNINNQNPEYLENQNNFINPNDFINSNNPEYLENQNNPMQSLDIDEYMKAFIVPQNRQDDIDNIDQNLDYNYIGFLNWGEE